MGNSDSVKFWWANWSQSLTTEQEMFVYHEKKICFKSQTYLKEDV